ncbi:MAG TPA: DUF4389 domain-containing protein [Pseudonocardiaceae bacterium]
MSDFRTSYPVRVDASLDASLSRGLWLVKWLLLIPHYIVLAFLWLAFGALSVVAFFAILFTGRYPRPLFDFNVAVLRWTWRVHYYGYGALGTDRYPPFTLADVPDYPAHLDVPYPERLSRRLVLVKWWLLAIPHYLILALFVGGGMWFGAGWPDGAGQDGWAFGGLVALLVFVAGVVLLFSGRYPTPIYDFVMGMDRWALRVAVYAGLMTDRYPPFRMDMGGTDPGSLPVAPPPTGPAGGAAVPPGSGPTPAETSGPAAGSPVASPTSTWTTGRVVSVVAGAILLLTSTGFLTAGSGLLWADQTQRDDNGYVRTPDAVLSTDLYALTTDGIVLEGDGLDWVVDDLLGTARLEAVPTAVGDELFLGVGRTADVDRYLGGVGRAMLGDQWDGGMPGPDSTEMAGGPPVVRPTEVDIWAASVSGTGRQVLDWRPAEGDWTVVMMRADGGAEVSTEIRVAATLPGLTRSAVVLLALGSVAALAGVLFIALAVHRAHRNLTSGDVPPDRLPSAASLDNEPALDATPRSS